jgi:cell division protein FtsB
VRSPKSKAQIDRLKISVSKLNDKLAGKARENEQLSREKEQQSARLGELYQDISC